MRRILKWVAIGLGGLLGLVILAGLGLTLRARAMLDEVYDVQVAAVAVPDGDPAALARGEHIARTIGDCTGCHAEDLSGQLFFDNPAIGRVVSRNITPAALGGYTDADYVRAIRHGLDRDNTPLLVMPAQHFQNMTDADLGALIAYLKSIPAIENDPGEPALTPLGMIMVGAGMLGAPPASLIDHANLVRNAPPEGATVEYGTYLISISPCWDCHGPNLAGGQAAPGEPIAPNLTPGGELRGWTQDDFFRAIREGIHPTGRQLDPTMPWQAYGQMTDTELEAIWLYLQSLPAREYEGPNPG